MGWRDLLDSVGQAARGARETISPWKMLSPSDVASFAPGGGLVNAWQDSGRGWQALKQGDYGQAAVNYGNMGLNLASEVAPWAKMAMAVAPAAKAGLTSDFFASRTANLYNPPVVPARHFEADYPTGALSNDAGRLSTDIEGRPLVAEFVAGRRVAGGSDEAIPAAKFGALSEATIGQTPLAVEKSAIRGDAGRMGVDRRSGNPVDIAFAKGLKPAQQERVVGHELGHAIDILADRVPTQGLRQELGAIYNDLNNPQSHGPKWTPKNNGYQKPDEVERELMAEAVRAYMADPNYIKTTAPETAARIRQYVNGNDKLKQVIQFNAIGGLGVLPFIAQDARSD